MVLCHEPIERVVERDGRVAVPVGKTETHLILHRRKRVRVGARRRETQVDQLEQRLQVLWRRLAGDAGLVLGKQHIDRGRLAGQHLLQSSDVQIAEPALREHGHGRLRRHEVRVVGQRSAARENTAEHDLVLVEIRGLQHDADAVREIPLRNTGLASTLRNHGRAGRRLVEQNLAGAFVDVRRQIRFCGRPNRGRERCFVGNREALLFGRGDHDDTARVVDPFAADGVDLLERDLGHEALDERAIVIEARHGPAPQERLRVALRE